MFFFVGAGTARTVTSSLIVRPLVLCFLLAHIVDFTVGSDSAEVVYLQPNEHSIQKLHVDSFGFRHLLDHEREDDHKEEEEEDSDSKEKDNSKESKLKEVSNFLSSKFACIC